MFDSLRNGIADFGAAIQKRNVWLALAIEDIGDQHKRTYLGPIWLLVNYLAFAGTFIVVFGSRSPIPNFSIYVAIGLIVWLYISEVFTLSVSLFTREEGFIKGTTLPLSVYVLRQTTQSIIRTGYAVCGCIAIVLYSGATIQPTWLWSVLSMLLIFAATPAAVLIFAVMGAYFPDLQFIVTNIMRIGLFLTPIFWIDAGSGGLRSVIYFWNPFTYFIEIVREPIYSGTVPIDAYVICVPACAALWIGALIVLGLARRRVAFIL